MLPILLAWLLDRLIGDPSWLPHPVVGMGRAISYFERWLNKGRGRMLKGALTALTLVGSTFAVTWGLLIALDEYCPLLAHTLRVILAFYCLAGRTLMREVRGVFQALERGLDEGRRQVARIVGRDTQSLTAQEVRQAALETLAENLSDGVVAPLFWYALAGVPGMLAYKMVNTLDSMVGYRTERYRLFGCVPARLDDVANFLPARLTALLMVVSASLLPWSLEATYPAGSSQGENAASASAGTTSADGGGDGDKEPTRRRRSLYALLRFVWHYGPQHASPNAGYPEAALAGILDCRFGGPHDYFGQEVWKPFIGQNDCLLGMADLRVALRVNLCTEILMLALTATACYLA